MKKGLGKGLGALITETSAPQQDEKGSVTEIDINKIEPNRSQPRKHFDEATLLELAESIKEYGVLQPLLVKEEEGYYSIIAGERRWRAARLAHLNYVPVIVKEYEDSKRLQIALVENLQREDLNPIEEATGFKRLMDEFFFSQEEVAEKIGKSKSAVSNTISLLALDQRVQNFISEQKLSPSIARVLLKLRDAEAQFQLAEKIIEEGLSAKAAEGIVAETLKSGDSKKKEKDKNVSKASNDYKHIADNLKQILGAKVNIRGANDKGKIEIEYFSAEELDRLYSFFNSKA